MSMAASMGINNGMRANGKEVRLFPIPMAVAKSESRSQVMVLARGSSQDVDGGSAVNATAS